MLVPKRDLPGAVSLQSVQMNLSRVIGPAIGGLLSPTSLPGGSSPSSAATYGFRHRGDRPGIAAQAGTTGEAGQADSGVKRLMGGVAVARRDPLVRYCLVTIFSISFSSASPSSG